MLPSIPTLRLDNRTPYDALQFDTVDQNGVPFHVIAAKTAYELGPCNAQGEATLTPATEPAPLYVADVYHDNNLEQSVRYESDLAPYKPHCDVIIIANAEAPASPKNCYFDVTLRVQRPALPPKPGARRSCPGDVLINKTLRVTGERQIVKEAAPFGWLLATPWRIATSAATGSLPLRYEYAFGGNCRVEAGDAFAARVPPQHHLTREQQANYPDVASPPLAHDSCQSNPCGRGFTRNWYLKASGVSALPAPRIEYPSSPFTAKVFLAAARGILQPPSPGMGYVGRAWLPRRHWTGTIDMKSEWQADEIPALPQDFDYRYWNGAPADQQCPHLSGGELFTLTNLCPATAPYARRDGKGNSKLFFAMPQQPLFLMAATVKGSLMATPLDLDTVVIDLDSSRIELTWRLLLHADGEFEEVRLHQAPTPEAVARLHELATANATSGSSNHRP